jgi:hypothetical protein
MTGTRKGTSITNYFCHRCNTSNQKTFTQNHVTGKNKDDLNGQQMTQKATPVKNTQKATPVKANSNQKRSKKMSPLQTRFGITKETPTVTPTKDDDPKQPSPTRAMQENSVDHQLGRSEGDQVRPVMVKLADLSCVVVPQGKTYASQVLGKQDWSKPFEFMESDSLEDLYALAEANNRVVFNQARIFGEIPLLSAKAKDQFFSLQDPQKLMPSISTGNHLSTTLPLLSDTKSTSERLTLRQKIQRKAQRGTNCLLVQVARPSMWLGCDKQLIFFDLHNQGANETYWSYRAKDFGTIFDENRTAPDSLIDNAVLEVFSYNKSDPNNTSIKLVKTVNLSKTNVTKATSISMDQMILGFMYPYEATQHEIEMHVKRIVTTMISEFVQELYNDLKSENATSAYSEDVKKDGKMWKALSASLSLVQFVYVDHLDDIIILQSAIDLAAKLFGETTVDITKWNSNEAKKFVSRQFE